MELRRIAYVPKSQLIRCAGRLLGTLRRTRMPPGDVTARTRPVAGYSAAMLFVAGPFGCSRSPRARRKP